MTKGIKITSALASELDKIIQESVKSALSNQALQEKEKQDQTAGAFSSTRSQKSITTEDNGDQSKESYNDPKANDIIEKLNSIRSGKSFKDESVSKSMEKYISDLSQAERVALFAFLKGIAQIVTGEIPGDKAFEPSDPPAGVSMKKDSSKQTRSIKPNIIKMSADANNKSKKSGEEDTASPVPITPKKK